MKKILIIDDNINDRNLFASIVASADFAPVDTCDGQEGIEAFKMGGVSTVLLDLRLPDMDGIEVLKELIEIDSFVPVIIITAHGDISSAIKAIKLGAYDFIIKPPNFDDFALTLKRAVEKMELAQEVSHLHTIFDSSLEKLLGKSKAVKKIAQEIQRVANSDFSIIIQGETGTGKTTLAREIHDLSRRYQKPFVKVDIGALSESLIESELFGHEKGSFTGAELKKKGFFEAAQGGTIFIDEIENLTLSAQSKLLNVLEEKRIYPVGSHKPVEIDFRVIAATNRDIKELVKEKKIREDLFYRLGEYLVELPPLRKRKADILFFAWKFIEEAKDDLNLSIEEIDDEAMNCLTDYSWPGNIRELKNFVKKAVLFSNGRKITGRSLNKLLQGTEEVVFSEALPLKEALKFHEKNLIKRAMLNAKGNKSQAASTLQTSYKNLLNKLKEFGLEKN